MDRTSTLFASLQKQKATYLKWAVLFFALYTNIHSINAQVVFSEDFGTTTTRQTSPYMPSGSFTWANPNGNTQQKALENNHYAIIDPTHIVDAWPDNWYWFWTGPVPSNTSSGTATAVLEDHTPSDVNGAVMAINAGSILNTFYNRDVVLEYDACYELSYWIYTVNATTGIQIELRDIADVDNQAANASLLSSAIDWEFSTSPAWRKVTYSFKFPATCSSKNASIRLKNANAIDAGDDYYIDDIKLEKIAACAGSPSPSCPITTVPVTSPPQGCQCKSTYGLSCTPTATNREITAVTLPMNTTFEGDWFISSSITSAQNVRMGQGSGGNVNPSSLKICSGATVKFDNFEFSGANHFHTIEIDEGATLEITLMSSGWDKVKIINNGTLIVHSNATNDGDIQLNNNLNELFNNGTADFYVNELKLMVAAGFTNSGVMRIMGGAGNLGFYNNNEKFCVTGGSSFDIKGYITSDNRLQLKYGGEATDHAKVIIRGKDASSNEVRGNLNTPGTGFFVDPDNNLEYYTSDGNLNIQNNVPTSTGTTSTTAGTCATSSDCVPASPVITYTVTPTDAGCLINNGKLTFNGLLPNIPYNISYVLNGTIYTANFTTDASGVGEITNLGPGTYKEITIARGCIFKTSTTDYVINQPTPVTPAVSITSDKTVICRGDSILFSVSSISNEGASPTYFWKKNGVNVGSGLTYKTSNLNTGDTISLLVASSETCVTKINAKSNVIEVTVNELPTITLDPISAICFGTTSASLAYTATTNSPDLYSIDWNATANTAGIADVTDAALPVSPITIPSLEAISAGTYTGTLSVKNSTTGCPATGQSISFTIHPTPTVVDPSNQILCNNTNTTAVTFTGAVAGTTFDWTNDDTSIGLGASGSGDIASFTAINTGTSNVVSTITVTPTANSCPGSSESFTITVKPTPTVVDPSNQILCNNTNTTAVTFTGAVAGTTFDWTNDDTSIGLGASGSGDISSFTAINTGTSNVVSTITVTPTANSCPGSSESFTITVKPTPTVVDPSNQILCNNANTTAVTFTGAVAGTTFDWTNDDTSIGLGASGSGDIASFTAINTGTSNVVSTITVTPTANSCPGSSESFTITVKPTPTVVDPSNQILCNNTNTTAVTFTGAVAGTTFDWTNDDTSIGLGASGSGDIASFTAINTGTSNVVSTITVTPTANSCPGSSESFTITVKPTPTVVDPSNQILCNNTNTTAVTFTGAVAGTTFDWTNDDTSIGLGASGSGDISSFTAINTGTSNVVSTITVTPTANSCPGSSESFTITVKPTPTVVDPSNQILCNNANTTAVTFTGAVAGTTFDWTNDDTSIGLGASGSGDIASFTAINTGTSNVVSTITVTPTANSCPGSSESFTITVKPTPTVVDPSNQILCNNTNTTAVTFTGAVAGTTFDWTNDDTSIGLGASGSGDIASFTAINTGTSNVVSTITVTPTANSCPGSSESFTITVKPTPTVVDPSNQILCNNTNTTAVTFTGAVAGTTFDWTNDDTSIGLGASDSGDIASFTAINTGTSNVVSTITVTPTANSCPGSSESFTITVKPTPVTSVNPSNPTSCSGNDGSITLTGLLNSISYDWTYTTPASVVINGTSSSDASGDLVLSSSLVSGSYTNISVTLNGCQSNVLSTSLSDPSAPTVDAGSGQQVCSTNPVTLTANNPDGATITWDNGVTDATAFTPAVGNVLYTVTADLAGCISTDTVRVIVDETPVLTVTAPAAVCSPNTVDITGAGSTTVGTLSYWTENTATTILNNPTTAGSGTYFIKATNDDNTSCFDIESVTVTVNPLPSFTISKTDPSTCSGTDGEIILSGLTANTTYTVSVNGAAGTSETTDATGIITLTGKGAGTYTNITVTTAQNCSTDGGSITLNDPSAPTVDAGAGQQVCSTNPVTLTANNPDGATITWDNGVTDATAFTPAVGNILYTVTADLAGCISTDTVRVIVDETPVLTVTAPAAVCSPNTVDITGAGSTTVGTLSYWTENTATTILNNPTTAGSGTYFIKATNDDNTSCFDIESVTVTVNPLPSFTISKTDPSTCSGTDGEIILSGLTANTTYTVSVNGAAGTSETTDATGIITLTGKGAGTYTNITVTTAQNCSTNGGSITLNDPSAPTVDAGSGQQVCSTNPVTLTANNPDGATITWDNGVTDATAFTPAVGNVLYTVTADLAGCISTDTVRVIVDETPVLTVTAPAAVCSPNTVDITGAGSTTVGTLSYWTENTATTILNNPTTAGSGTYFIKATNDDNTSCFDIESVTVTVNPLPSFTISKTDPSTCSGTDGEIILSGLTANTTYTVSVNGAAGTSETTDATGIITLTGKGAGTYTNITVTTAQNCSTNGGSITLNDPSAPTVDAGSGQQVCSTNPVTLTANNPDGATITWDNGVTDATAFTPAVGNVLYTVTADLAGCISTDTVRVIVDETPVLTVTAPAAVCSPNTVDITGAGSTTVGTLSYWTENTATTILNNPTTAGSGTYFIKATNDDNTSCFDIESVTVTVNPLPSFTISKTDPSTCSGTDGEIILSGLTANTTYTVSVNGAAGTSETTDATGIITLTGKGAGTYTNITVTTAQNCSTDGGSITLNDPSAPTVDAGSGQQVCSTNSVTLTANNPDGATLSWDNGVTDATAFTPAVGNVLYTVTADLAGCISTDTVRVIVDETPVLTVTAPAAVCSPNTVDITGAGSTTVGTLSYWTENTATTILNNPTTAGSGTYFIKATNDDNTSCFDIESVTVTVNPLPSFTISKTDPSTCSGTDGEIILSGLTANTTYTVSVNGEAGTSETTDATGVITLTGKGAGTYTNITVTTAQNCSTDGGSITLNDPSAPTVDAGAGQQVCSTNSVTLTANNPDGATLSWDNGVTDATAFTPAVGNVLYTVTADLAGCISTDTVRVIVDETPVLTVTAPAAVCSPNTVDITGAGSTTVGTLSYWTENTATTILNNPTTAGSGTYFIKATNDDNTSCFDIESVTVTVNPLPSFTISKTDPSTCSGTDGEIILSGLTANTTYTVSVNGAAGTSETTDATGIITLTGKGAGTYTNITVTTAQNCSTDGGSITLNDPSAPTVDAGSGQQVCSTNPVTLTANNPDGATITWDNGVTDATAFTPAVGNVLYTVTADLAGCISTDTVRVIVDETPVLTVTAPAAVCSPNTVDITGAGSTTVGTLSYWTENTATTILNNPTTAGSGTYFIKATNDDNTSCFDIESVTVTVNPLPSFTISKTDPSTCSGTDGEIILSGLTANTTYTVSVNGAAGTSETTDATGIITLTGKGAGTYTNITVTTAQNCSTDGGSITLNDPSAPTVDAGSGQQVCSTNPVTLTANNPDGATITWDNGVTDATAFTPAVGNVLYTVTADLAGCISTDTVRVIVDETPVLTVTAPAAVCSPNTVDITGAGSTTVGTLSYWTENTATTILNNPTTAGSGTYFIKATNDDNTSCFDIESVTVTVNPLPSFTISKTDPSTCSGTDGEIILSGLTANTTYTVSVNGAAGTSETTDATGVITLTGKGAGTYTNITVTTAQNCSTDGGSITLNDPSAPTVDAGAGQQVCSTNPVTLTANNPDGATITWDNGVTDATAFTPAVGNILYTVTADLAGCISTDTVRVIVDETPVLTVTAPAAVCSPNTVDITGAGSTTVGTLSYWTENTATTILNNPTTAGSGTYFIKATNDDNTSCFDIESVTVTVNPLPSFTISKTDPSTCSGTDGEIILSGLTANTTYTVSVNGAAGTSETTDATGIITLTGKGAGTYTNITVTTAQNCSTDGGSITLNDPSAPTVDAGSGQQVCSTNPVTLTANNPDGATITWDNGVTDATAFTPAVGNVLYTVTADLAGCISTDTVRVIVDETPVLTVTAPAAVCSPNTVDITGAGSTTVGTLSYWTENTATTILNNPTTAGSGTYFIKATNDDNTSCFDIESVTVTVNPLPSFTISKTDPSTCSGTDGEIILSGLTANTTYTVSVNGAAGTSETTDATGIITLTGKGAGTYTNITVTTAQNCSTNGGSITLNDPSAPTVDAGSGQQVCSTNPVTLTANNPDGATITWDNGVTDATAFTPAVGNVLYTVTADLAGCISTDTVRVIVDETPVLTVTAPAAVCSPNTVDITGAGSTTVGTLSYWTENTATTILNNPTTAGSGTYFIKATNDDNTSCFDIESVTVTVNPLPSFTISKTDPSTCSGTDGEIILSGLTANTTYTVSVNGEAGTSETTDATGVITLTGKGAGTYTNITVTTAQNCSTDGGSITLNDPSAPTVDAGAGQQVCSTNPVTLTANNPDGATITWDNGVTDATAFTPAVGNILYTVTADLAGCISTDTVRVIVDETPVLTVTAPAAVCSPNTVDITGAGSTTVGTLSYWTENTATTILNNPTTAGSGTYFIKATNDDNTSCFDIESVTVTVNPLPSFTISKTDPSTCSGTDGEIILSGLTANTTYTVSVNGEAGTSETTDATGVITLTGKGAGTYTNITVTTAQNCSTDGGSITLNDPSAPTVDAGAGQQVCSTNSVTLTANNPDGATITWDNGVTDATAFTPAVGNILYTVTADLAGCISTDTVRVIVDETPVLTVTAPAAVCSPNTVDITGAGSTTVGTLSYWTENTATTILNNPTTAGSGTYFIKATNDDNTSCFDIESVTVTVNPLPSFTISKTDPSTCSGTDGEIILSGLTANTTYTVSVNGAAGTSETTDATGIITLTGKGAGTYTNITVTTAQNCSTDGGSITLNDPSAPSIAVSKLDPTCALNDGELMITGVKSGFSFPISYDVNGSTVNLIQAAINDTIRIPNLLGATYTNITLDSLNCKDVVPAIILNSPVNPVVSVSKIDPTCANTDGEISISSLTDGFAYTLTMDSLGTTITKKITSVGGSYNMSGLGFGNYGTTVANIDSLGCSVDFAGQTLAEPANPTQSQITALASSVCEGTSTNLSLSNYTGTIQWQDSSATGWANIIGATTDQLTVQPTLAESPKRYRALVEIGGLCKDTSAAEAITVLFQPVAGTIAGADTICIYNSTTISVSGTAGTLQWQSSQDELTWTNMPGETTSSITVSPDTADSPIYYRVIAGQGTNCADTSLTHRLAVKVCCIAPTSAALTPDKRICDGETATIGVSSTDAPSGYIYTWFSLQDTTVVYQTGADLNSITSTQTDSFYVDISMPNFASCKFRSDVSAVKVTPLPVLGTLTVGDNSLCDGATSQIQGSGFVADSIYWQVDSISNNTWETIAENVSDIAITSTQVGGSTSYRVVVQNGNLCYDTTSVEVVNTLEQFVGGVATLSNAKICDSTSTSVSVSGQSGPIQWEKSLDGTTWSSLGASTATVTINGTITEATTYYRAIIGNGECADTSTVDTLIVVPDAAYTAILQDQTICDGSSAQVSLAGVQGTIQWQDSTAIKGWSNIANATQSSLTVSPALAESVANYRAILTNSGMCTDTTSAVKVTVLFQNVAGLIQIQDDTICENTQGQLSVVGSKGSIQWQKQVSGTWTDLLGETNPTLTQIPLYADGDAIYRVVLGSGQCADTTKPDTLHVLEGALAGTPQLSRAIICEGEFADVTLKNYRGTITWERSLNGAAFTTIPEKVDSFRVIPVVAQSPLRYKAQVVNSGECSATSVEITLTVVPAVKGGVVEAVNPLICDGNSTKVNLRDYVGNITWQDSTALHTWQNRAEITNQITVNPSVLESPTLYRVIVSNGVCSDTSTKDRITIYPQVLEKVEFSYDPEICASEEITFRVTDSLGGGQDPSFKWYINDIQKGTGVVFTTKELTANATIKVVMKTDSICADPTVQMNHNITVKPLFIPSVSITSPASAVCANVAQDFNILSLENGGLNPVYTWYVKSIKGVDYKLDPSFYLYPSGTAIRYNFLKDKDQVYAVMTPSDDICTTVDSAVSNKVQVQIADKPSYSFSPYPDTTVCAGSPVEIKFNSVNGTVSWYWSESRSFDPNFRPVTALSSPTGTINVTNSVLTGKVPTNDVLTVYYKAVISNNQYGLTCPSISEIITVFEYPNPKGHIVHENECEADGQLAAYSDNGFYTKLDNWKTSNDGKKYKEFSNAEVIKLSEENYFPYKYVMATFKSSNPNLTCSATDTIEIGICPVDIPNALTPNGDGDNERFYVKNIQYYPNNELWIYNRWGTLIWHQKAYKNDWYGKTFNGQQLPVSTYYYVLDLGNGDVRQGYVSIIK